MLKEINGDEADQWEPGRPPGEVPVHPSTLQAQVKPLTLSPNKPTLSMLANGAR